MLLGSRRFGPGALREPADTSLVLEVDAERVPRRRADIVGRVGRAQRVPHLEHHVGAGDRPCGVGLRRAALGVAVLVEAGSAEPGRIEEEVPVVGIPEIVAELADAVVVVVEDDIERRCEAGGRVLHDGRDIEMGRCVDEAESCVSERSEGEAVLLRVVPLRGRDDAVDRRSRPGHLPGLVRRAAVSLRDPWRGARECREEEERQPPIRKTRPLFVRPSPKTVNRHRPSLDLSAEAAPKRPPFPPQDTRPVFGGIQEVH